jgi:hypothetical protein
MTVKVRVDGLRAVKDECQDIDEGTRKDEGLTVMARICGHQVQECMEE